MKAKKCPKCGWKEFVLKGQLRAYGVGADIVRGVYECGRCNYRELGEKS